jgi:hypothetical protein
MAQTQTPDSAAPKDAMQDAVERAGAVNGERDGEIAADDAGATSLAEKMARNAEPRSLDEDEKSKVGAEASRQTDA